jgi:hypothetical protein
LFPSTLGIAFKGSPRFEREAKMAGYDSHPAGDAMEFSTTPEPVPQPWLLVAIPGGLLVLIALAESIV